MRQRRMNASQIRARMVVSVLTPSTHSHATAASVGLREVTQPSVQCLRTANPILVAMEVHVMITWAASLVNVQLILWDRHATKVTKSLLSILCFG